MICAGKILIDYMIILYYFYYVAGCIMTYVSISKDDCAQHTHDAPETIYLLYTRILYVGENSHA